MKNLLENFLENHLDKHTYPMIAELAKNVLSVNNREIRSGILLSIEGVKLENNMTFTLENKENKDYSYLIDISKILDCSEEMFKNYLEEFKSTEKSNYLHLKKQDKFLFQKQEFAKKYTEKWMSRCEYEKHNYNSSNLKLILEMFLQDFINES